MAEIVSIRFKREGKQYYFDPVGITVHPGDGVMVETSWGLEFGECVRGNSEVPESDLVAPLRPVIRLATDEDLQVVARNREKEKSAFVICQEKIAEHQLDMKLVDVEYSFEGNKILFFFISEGRVDFRALVKNLASIFHTRIELRQIGVRDEAKLLGGLGICGRPFCCATFLTEFQPVSIKMAKTQSLSLNPTKISGTCGRLMCCLKYEQDAYEDLLKSAPKVDSFVETPDGVGTIISANTLREKVRVRLDNEPDTLKTYHNSEISVVRSGKGKRPDNYQPPSPEELAKRRRVTEKDGQQEAQEAFSASLHAFSIEEEQREPRESHEAPRGRRQEKTEHAGHASRGDGPHEDHRRSYRNQGKRKPDSAAHAGASGEKREELSPPGGHAGEKRRSSNKSGRANRSTKAASQAAMQRALPQEGGEGPGEKTEKKPNHSPRWRRRPHRGGKKGPAEGKES